MSTPVQDWIAVAEVANGYYRAMYAGEEGMLRELFDPRAPVVGNAMGNHLAMSLDTFIERSVASRGTHGEAESRIDGMTIIGDTAQVTVGGRYRELWFTDTLVMVRREDGNWRIDAKTFFADSTSGEREARAGSDGTCQAVEAVANAYYEGMVNGDAAGLRAIFDPGAPIVGTMDGAFMWQSLDAFIEESQTLVGQHGDIASRIDNLQITGDMALVTVGGRYWKRWFTDQLAMVREPGTSGSWGIHAKSFYCHPAGDDQA